MARILTINGVQCKLVEQVNNTINVCFRNTPQEKVQEILTTLQEKYNSVEKHVNYVFPMSMRNNNMTGYFACKCK